MAANIHVGDIGTAFQYQCLDQDGNVIDLSSSTVQQIKFVRPDKSSFTVQPSFVTNGSDGWVQYLSVAGDLSLPGFYTSQVYIQWGAAPGWHSDVDMFKVLANS